MCKEFDDNRTLLTALIYKMAPFTTKEIIDAYKTQKGNAIIDGSESIAEFVENMVSFGVIRYDRGKYIVTD